MQYKSQKTFWETMMLLALKRQDLVLKKFVVKILCKKKSASGTGIRAGTRVGTYAKRE
jgi:hypothetical protein